MEAFGGVKNADRYALDVAKSRGAKAFTLSPMGAANSMAFANTAVTPDLAYDESRLNARFLPFNVELQSKDGKMQKEQVVAVVGLKNPRTQILLEYGPNYLQQFKREAAVKSEVEDTEPIVRNPKRGKRGREAEEPQRSSGDNRYDSRRRDRLRSR